MICEIICIAALASVSGSNGLGTDGPSYGGGILAVHDSGWRLEGQAGASSIGKVAGRGTAVYGSALAGRWLDWLCPAAGIEGYSFNGPFEKSGVRPFLGFLLGSQKSHARIFWKFPDSSHNRVRGISAGYRHSAGKWYAEGSYSRLRFDLSPKGVPLGTDTYSEYGDQFGFSVGFFINQENEK